MWELDYEESWALKNWCFWTVVLEKTLESPLDCKEMQQVQPKGNQSWVFFGRTDAEAETPVLWPPDVKSWLIWKDPDTGTDWRQEEKGMTEEKMVGWHHWLNGHGFGLTPGVGWGQGGLACCSSWDHKELDMTEWLNWTELISKLQHLSDTPLEVWVWSYSYFNFYILIGYYNIQSPCNFIADVWKHYFETGPRGITRLQEVRLKAPTVRKPVELWVCSTG